MNPIESQKSAKDVPVKHFVSLGMMNRQASCLPYNQTTGDQQSRQKNPKIWSEYPQNNVTIKGEMLSITQVFQSLLKTADKGVLAAILRNMNLLCSEGTLNSQ